MNLASLNPFKKVAEPFVWIHADPNHPHVGLAKFSDKPKADFWPNVKVTGIKLADAKAHFTGKVIEYNRIPRSKLEELKDGDLSITMKVEEFKGLFR